MNAPNISNNLKSIMKNTDRQLDLIRDSLLALAISPEKLEKIRITNQRLVEMRRELKKN